jgi:predicted tellurium resistance membrane protein TerC
MQEFLTADSLISLLTLCVMEIVLGIDNVIFVSIVMNRLPEHQKKRARTIWMVAGISVRIILLMLIGKIVKATAPLFTIFGNDLSLRDLIMLGGGLFLLVKTTMEIHHKLEGDGATTAGAAGKASAGFFNIIGQIIVIDLVFSFDSIITAVGLAKHTAIMVIAVIVAMIMMFVFAEKISSFIAKHPTLKMLALAFLVMIGSVLVMEGWAAEKAHELHIKNYVYFAMAFSVGVELLNMKVRKKQSTSIVHLKGPEEAAAHMGEDSMPTK